jgi:hypothetical protein
MALFRKNCFVAAKTFGFSFNPDTLIGVRCQSNPFGYWRQEYPFRHLHRGLILLLKKWKPGLFIGYTQNLGTDDPLISSDKVYGLGLTIDRLLTFNASFSYNLPHWQIGFEYCPATAWYGNICPQTGKVVNSQAVTNHRLLGLVMYYF